MRRRVHDGPIGFLLANHKFIFCGRWKRIYELRVLGIWIHWWRVPTWRCWRWRSFVRESQCFFFQEKGKREFKLMTYTSWSMVHSWLSYPLRTLQVNAWTWRVVWMCNLKIVIWSVPFFKNKKLKKNKKKKSTLEQYILCDFRTFLFVKS